VNVEKLLQIANNSFPIDKSYKFLNLNLGCGDDYLPNFLNVDLAPHKLGVFKYNLNNFPYPWKDNSVRVIYIRMCLEHLENIHKIMREFYRIMKNDGFLIIIVPHYNCKGAYTDITHKHFFSDDSMKQFADIFNILKVIKKPSRFGKLFPVFLRDSASYVFGEIYSEITFVLEKHIKDEFNLDICELTKLNDFNKVRDKKPFEKMILCPICKKVQAHNFKDSSQYCERCQIPIYKIGKVK
jgi:SAM-dependent methyltransferase